MVAADPKIEAATSMIANFKFLFMCFLNVKLLYVLIFLIVNFNFSKSVPKVQLKMTTAISVPLFFK